MEHQQNQEFEEQQQAFASNEEQDSPGNMSEQGEPATSPEQERAETTTQNNAKEKFVLNLSEEDLDQAPVLEESAEEPSSDGEVHKNQKKKSGKKGKKIGPGRAIFYTALIISLSLLFSTIILLGANDIFAFYKQNKDIQIEIPRNSSTKQIASILKEKGIINYPLLFRFVSKSSDNDGKYQYGLYTLNPAMGYDTLMSELQKNAPKKDVVTLTIVEGQTLWQIAEMLEENEICDAEDFVYTINHKKFGYDFEDQIVEDNPLKYHRVEGYVFPDTYEFYKYEEPESVAKKIMSNFNKKITADLYGRMKDLDLTLEQTLTLASIVQAESGQADQLRKVSSVFWNRLEHPSEFPSLQSDVTREYVNNNIKPHLKSKNQEMYDAYNTYVCKALPAGPICNPGLDAIKAALYPEDTGYYYFLTDKEGNFYYAKTLREHNRNKKNAGL